MTQSKNLTHLVMTHDENNPVLLATMYDLVSQL